MHIVARKTTAPDTRRVRPPASARGDPYTTSACVTGYFITYPSLHHVQNSDKPLLTLTNLFWKPELLLLFGRHMSVPSLSLPFWRQRVQRLGWLTHRPQSLLGTDGRRRGRTTYFPISVHIYCPSGRPSLFCSSSGRKNNTSQLHIGGSLDLIAKPLPYVFIQ